MLVSFEPNVIKKLETLRNGTTNNKNDNSSRDFESCPTRNHTGGKWCHWGGKYRRVLHDWEFPNKMTLRTAWHQWFLEDHKNQVCPLRYLKSTDLHNCKNGRRNISSMKTLMNAMISEAQKKMCMSINQLKSKLVTCFKLLLVKFVVCLKIKGPKHYLGIHT